MLTSAASNALTITSGSMTLNTGHFTVGGTGSTIAGLTSTTNISNVSAVTASGLGTFSGLLTAGTIKGSSNGSTISSPMVVYTNSGSIVASTIHLVSGSFVGNGGTNTITFSGNSVFANANYMIRLYDSQAGTGTVSTTTRTTTGFTYGGGSTNTYVYVAVGI